MVGQDGAVGLEEVLRVVAEISGGEGEQLGAAVEKFIDCLACVGGAGVFAEQFLAGRCTGVLDFDPGICEPVLAGEGGNVVGNAGVA